jgi:hypothetical protein
MSAATGPGEDGTVRRRPLLGEACLLYVSRRLATDEDVRAIVEASLSRNRSLGVTGALMATKLHFAQYLEGAPGAVRDLMTSIRADGRHTDVTVFLDAGLERRRFQNWWLAYAGASSYVDQHLSRLIRKVSPETTIQQIQVVLTMMERFIA